MEEVTDQDTTSKLRLEKKTTKKMPQGVKKIPGKRKIGKLLFILINVSQTREKNRGRERRKEEIVKIKNTCLLLSYPPPGF